MGRTQASVKAEQPGKPRDAATKLARQRLSALELAAELGNSAEPAGQREIDLTLIYEWRRRFQTRGFAGL